MYIFYIINSHLKLSSRDLRMINNIISSKKRRMYYFISSLIQKEKISNMKQILTIEFYLIHKLCMDYFDMLYEYFHKDMLHL